MLVMGRLPALPIYTEPAHQEIARPLPNAAASRTLTAGMGGTMRIEILCTGDEVLTGKIVNTNFSYMAQKLEDVGLSVHWGTTVGDDRESLLNAFRLAGDRGPGGRGRTGAA
jgi:hypothetical protein